MQLSPRVIAALSVAACGLGLAAVPGRAGADGDWRIAVDSLVYDDTDNVTVVTPRLSVHRRIDEDGGMVGARVLVDVVSAASVDVVSQATLRFSEARTEVGLDVSKSLEGHLLSGQYRFSIEPDYTSHGGALGWQTRLGTPDTVLAAGYGLTYDVVGRSGTSWEAFSRELFSHAVTLSLTQTLGRGTILRGVGTLQIQHGYLEKPYRHVPLFAAATIQSLDGAGVRLDLDNFDEHRLPARPPEEVPDLRVGGSVGLRLLQSVDPIEGSVRADYQLYVDGWGVSGHAFEAALTGTVIRGLRLVGYGRFYLQTAASFWRREYVVDDAGSIPRYRTLDRDLSSYHSLTGGARVEWEFEQVSGYVDGAVMWTHYDDFLLLDDRIALFGQIGFRWSP